MITIKLTKKEFADMGWNNRMELMKYCATMGDIILDIDGYLMRCIDSKIKVG